MRLQTPFGWLAGRVVLGDRALRWGTAAALLTSIGIIVTGGVVRVTGSGLGCPDWPACDAGSLASTPELGMHGLIEFVNRVLTFVLIVAVGWAITAARLQPVRQRPLTRLAWSQFWLVVVNAIAGGITVWMGLNPYIVAVHFLLAMALLTTTTLTYHRARQSAATADVRGPARPLAWALAASGAVLVVLGTVVTGAGPHSGDDDVTHRFLVDWTLVTALHGVAAGVVIALTVALIALLRSPGETVARRRAWLLLAVLLAQGLIGLVQSLVALPALLVVLHLLGAALVWVGVVRVLLDVRPALFGRIIPVRDRPALLEPPVREPVGADR